MTRIGSMKQAPVVEITVPVPVSSYRCYGSMANICLPRSHRARYFARLNAHTEEGYMCAASPNSAWIVSSLRCSAQMQ